MSKLNVSILVIAVIYTVGIIGLLSPYRLYFQAATPLTLLISAGLLIWNHQEFNLRFFIFIAICLATGFFAEYLGVNFGLIFGNYQYGQTLGFQFLNVPLLIGVNWFITIYSIAVVMHRLKLPVYLSILIGALLAVGFDWLLEPVAVHFDFWSWENGIIPIKNYVGWFFVSAFLLATFVILKIKAVNPLAVSYFVIECLFFLVLNLASRLVTL